MKVIFADTFFESLRKIENRNKWYVRLFDLFRYNIPWFFRNIWAFRRDLWTFRAWDYQHNLSLFKRSLELLRDNIQKCSHEVDESRLPKLEAMLIVLSCMELEINDGYIDLAEKELKTKYDDVEIFEESTENNKRIFAKAEELEKEHWNEMWNIIKGNDRPGSDMRGWWD